MSEYIVCGEFFKSIRDIYNYYKDEKWVAVGNYVEYARRIREDNLSPEQALYFNKEDILNENNKFDNEQLSNVVFYKRNQEEEFLKKELFRCIIESSVYCSLKSSKKGNAKRNCGIFLKRIFFDLTLEEIGTEYGVTRERVRQICSKMNYSVATKLRKSNIIDDKQYKEMIKF